MVQGLTLHLRIVFVILFNCVDVPTAGASIFRRVKNSNIAFSVPQRFPASTLMPSDNRYLYLR